MSVFTQFVGEPPIGSIVNNFSTSGASGANLTNVSAAGKEYLSGALTANTLATVLSVTVGGTVNLVAVRSVNGTTRTIRVKITLDGVVVFDATSASIAVANTGVVPVGFVRYSTDLAVTFQPISFSKSMLIEIASSLTETDLLNTVVNYHTNV